MFAAAVTAWPLAARSQNRATPLIGFLSSRSATTDSGHLLAALRAGLGDGGYIDGESIAIEYRWADGRYDRLPALAAELVERQVAVLIAVGGAPAALAAKAATSIIPIVFGTGGDPVKVGLVASLSRPGGNITGVALLTAALEAKRLSLLRELIPQATSIAVLIDPTYQQGRSQFVDVQNAARESRQDIHVLEASTDAELDAAFASLEVGRDKALLVTADPFFDTRRDRIVALALRFKLPAIYQFRDYAAAGGLLSYGIDLDDAYRQYGAYAARILKGAKPSDLPVVQARKFQFVINLKTAAALGLTIPPTLLARADEVIE
jgi:putative ABC transport system substrate-binding protein